MPAFCSVVGCSKRAERDQNRYFRIPRALQNRGEMLDALSKERRECWVRALRRGNLSDTFLKHARICADHFVSGEPAKLEDRDSPDWVPSLNMGYTNNETHDEQSMKRCVRLLKRQTKRLKMDEAGNTALNIEPTAGSSTETKRTPELCNEHKSHRTVNTQTDLTMDHLNKLFEDLDFAKQKMYALEEKLNASDLTEESFQKNSKCSFILLANTSKKKTNPKS